MTMDLIISDKGAVMIASNHAFPAEVSSVEFHIPTQKLSIAYRDSTPSHLLAHAVQDRLKTEVLSAARITVIYFKNGFAQDGYNVPLIQMVE